MFRIDRRFAITVDLNPGVYLLPDESGVGKTYLCNTLCKYSAYGDPVSGITWYDMRVGDWHYKLKPGARVVLFDRLDRYFYGEHHAELVESINSIRESCVVLLDSKTSGMASLNPGHCHIKVERTGITVTAS